MLLCQILALQIVPADVSKYWAHLPDKPFLCTTEGLIVNIDPYSLPLTLLAMHTALPLTSCATQGNRVKSRKHAWLNVRVKYLELPTHPQSFSTHTGHSSAQHTYSKYTQTLSEAYGGFLHVFDTLGSGFTTTDLLTLTHWPSETYQMAQNGELFGLPCSAGLSSSHTLQRKSQPMLIVITGIPNSALNVVPFTHTHTHSLSNACWGEKKRGKKITSPPPVLQQQQHVCSRKEVGGFEEKKKGPQEGSQFLLGPSASDLARQVDTRQKRARISRNNCFDSGFVPFFGQKKMHHQNCFCVVLT